MFSWLQARAKHRATIERLHAEIVAAARDPAFFGSYRIADTVEGRFEVLTLHAWLTLRRLAALPPPGRELAQDLTDLLFRHFDLALRELGVGDTSVPKRMRHLAEAFLGRCAAYDAALAVGHEAVVAALARNVYGGAGDPRRLGAYVVAAETVLSGAPLAAFAQGPVPFPAPSRVPAGTG
jgi:cytochrome b pre-mRNA-processing protein 3